MLYYFKLRCSALSLLFFCFALSAVSAGEFIVADGKSNAEIVISKDEHRPRMLALAALELQYYLQKISGARLPIVTEPTDDFPVKIYVGRSEHTDRLGVSDEGLKFGAFRIISGDDWLVLLGQDHDFAPPDPYPRSHGDRARVQDEWDEKVGDRTDAAWGYPFGGVYKSQWALGNYDEFMAERYGADNKHVWDPRDLEPTNDYQGPGMGGGFWMEDRGGSINAVYEFLRSLGARWYMPGELGEVIPRHATIALPGVDRTVHPDFPLRSWLGSRSKDIEGLLWKRRVGIESAFETLGFGGTHGMDNVLIRDEMKEKHPDYYALIGGERITGLTRGEAAKPCFSSEGLVDESVAYLKFRFDEYGERMVQFSPPDGLRKCECDQCEPVPTSDLVFGFINRVAQKLYETNPDNVVLAAAYSTYKVPPEGIDKLSPNVAITLNNWGRPLFTNPEAWQTYWEAVEGWQQKVAPGQLMRVENNRYEVRTPTFPVIHPRATAKDLRAMKGLSVGERNEISLGKGTVLNAPGLSHLTLYVNARFLWDADQDIDKLLDEYYGKFYGPASAEMKDALEYAATHVDTAEGNRAGMDFASGAGFLDRLLKAHEAAGDSVYGERIEMMLDEIVPAEVAGAPEKLVPRAETYLENIRKRAAALAAREPARVYGWWNIGSGKWDQAREDAEWDGRLDEAYWRHGSGFHDKHGRETRISILYSSQWLYVGIRSEIDPERELQFKAVDNEDPAVLEGDHVEFLLETDAHSFYQVAVNPAGAVYSRDMSEGGASAGETWASQAETAVHIGDQHWSVEMRLPLDQNGGDPFHKVVARRSPVKTFPWYFNILTVRVVDGEKQVSAFVIPEEGDLYDPFTFAELSRPD